MTTKKVKGVPSSRKGAKKDVQRGKGRPPKFTEQSREEIIAGIESACLTYEAACGNAGVDYSTFRRWIRAGEDAERKYEEGESLTVAEIEFRDFYHTVNIAEAKARSKLEALFFRGAVEDWRAAKEFLARRYPSAWGGIPAEAQDLVIVVKGKIDAQGINAPRSADSTDDDESNG